MLDLVRLSRRPLFPPGGVDLYRQIAILTDMADGDEVLDSGCGVGVTLEYFVTEFDVHGSGVEPDRRLVAAAEKRIRSRGLQGDLQIQRAPLDSLPYRDEIFDVVVGELGLTSRAEPAAAVEELVRVARPGAAVVLVQLVWKAPVDEERRRLLADHLGVQPLMLVEWKRLLRDAGVERLHSEDWSDEETAFRPRVTKPFPDFAELFSLWEKLGILKRAWGRWGFRGVRAVLEREREVHRLLTRERILGLDLVVGFKPEAEEGAVDEPGGAAREGSSSSSMGEPPGESGEPGGEPGPDADAEGPGGSDETWRDPEAPRTAEHEETAGLPLFGHGEEER